MGDGANLAAWTAQAHHFSCAVAVGRCDYSALYLAPACLLSARALCDARTATVYCDGRGRDAFAGHLGTAQQTAIMAHCRAESCRYHVGDLYCVLGHRCASLW